MELGAAAHNMIKLDPKKQFISQIVFDGARSIQKVGQIMAQHYPRVEVYHGVEHIVALVMEKFVKMTPLKEYSKFVKLVEFCVRDLFLPDPS